MRFYSALRIPHSELRGGQSSLEMTLALIGALVLLFGSLRVFFWVGERMVQRQRQYEQSRARAASAPQAKDRPAAWGDVTWDDGRWSEKDQKLQIFK